MTRNAALSRLGAWERLELCSLPTRLIRAPRLAQSLGVPELDLWVKMDSETGFALGGNKVRKLEYWLAPSRLEEVTHVLTAGGPQSNHCRVTAAAAAHLGLRCTLVLGGPEPEPPTGNALLHRLFAADIVTVADRSDRTPRMEALAEELTCAGERPLVVPIGASDGLGSLGYVRAAVEMVEQLDGIGPAAPRTVVFVPSSSCGTLAGMLLGMSILGRGDVLLVGVSADAPADDLHAETVDIARQGADLLDWSGQLQVDELVCLDSQVGAGYGISTPASEDAIALFGRSEGLVLDPTYTAKAAAGMLEWLDDGRVAPRDRVVFLHTGGHPGLLA